jgi:hypothetical protein
MVLLITPGTGETRPETSLTIQIEVWRNQNVENQVYGRAHRTWCVQIPGLSGGDGLTAW